MVSRETAWLDDRVDILLAALADYGMNASRSAASELIQERVSWVAAQSGIGPAAARRYLTDEALRNLARTMALAVADEAPGADVLESPRTAAVPVAVLGRTVAGLSEAILLRLRERDDLGHVRTTTAQLAHALSALGQVISESDEPVAAPATSSAPAVMVPPALLKRAARYLEAAAALVRDQGVLPEDFDPAHGGKLADTFRQDAAAVRLHADT